MTSLIQTRVEAARAGSNPYVITRLASGWVVIGDSLPLPGYCLLLADPIVASLNDLSPTARARYALDMIAVGDAILEATGAARINYETWGNLDPALHTHITPRYATEPSDKRVRPACVAYDFAAARAFDPVADAPFMEAMRRLLDRSART